MDKLPMYERPSDESPAAFQWRHWICFQVREDPWLDLPHPGKLMMVRIVMILIMMFPPASVSGWFLIPGTERHFNAICSQVRTRSAITPRRTRNQKRRTADQAAPYFETTDAVPGIKITVPGINNESAM